MCPLRPATYVLSAVRGLGARIAHTVHDCVERTHDKYKRSLAESTRAQTTPARSCGSYDVDALVLVIAGVASVGVADRLEKKTSAHGPIDVRLRDAPAASDGASNVASRSR